MIHPFKEGYAVTTKKGTDIITGFFDTNGKFAKLKGWEIARAYPYFKNGYLLVRNDHGYKFINPKGVEQQSTCLVSTYPFNQNYASCMTYKNMEKMKNPYYTYINTSDIPISFSYNEKEFDNEDVQFLSSLTDDGKGIAIIKRKVYWYDKSSQALTPIFARKDETNPKHQVYVQGDASEYMSDQNDSIVIQGKGYKTDFLLMVFNKMLKPYKIYYSDRIEEIEEEVETEAKYTSPLSSFKDEGSLYGLKCDGNVALPAQFDGVGFLVNNLAAVRTNGKWGVLACDKELNYRFIMHEGKDIAFRHRDVSTTIRLELPTAISADKCRFNVADQHSCTIDKISLETKNTENGNYVQYKCVLSIPDSLPDVLTDIQYPMQITYDGLTYPTVPLHAKAWHYKYINVDLMDSETAVNKGNLSFTFNIAADKQPGENDYPLEVSVHTDSLPTQLEKISETRYKCNISALTDSINSINIKIMEEGCPPYVFPFDIIYKPTKGKENITIQKK